MSLITGHKVITQFDILNGQSVYIAHIDTPEIRHIGDISYFGHTRHIEDTLIFTLWTYQTYFTHWTFQTNWTYWTY